jgi:hypothetical protein
MSTAPVQQSDPHAVLDTNVGFTIYSWNDLIKAMADLQTKNGTVSLSDPALAYRKRRARSAFFLALFLNERKWKTLAPPNEYQRTLVTVVPPNSVAANFTKLFLHFIKDHLLLDWEAGSFSLSDDINIKGNDVDLLCLNWAQQYQIPLISWEGDTPTGPDPTRLIPREAKARGINLVTPERLMIQHQFVEGPAVKRFFADWDAHAGAYLKGNPGARETMIDVRQFFERLRDNYWGP